MSMIRVNNAQVQFMQQNGYYSATRSLLGVGETTYALSSDDLRDGKYKAPCWVVVAEMNYPVTATVKINGALQEETSTQSVKGYVRM